MKIGKKESETVEFKKSTSELKEAVIDMCAMLNKHGRGEIYFGVKNDGEICGQAIGADTLRDVSKAIADNIKPAVYPKINSCGKGVLKYINVVFSGKAPLYHAYGRAYIRTADESRMLTPDEQADMLRARSGSTWETGLSDKRVKDASVPALKEYIKRAREAGRLDYKYTGAATALKKLGLVKNGRLIKAAEILFCDENQGELKAAVFAGKDKMTFLDIRQYKGTLFELLQKGVDYLKEHMNWRADLTGQRRVEIPEVPVRAITEAVVNSLCHRDYESPEANE
ncbi:MAG: putative DNA binding domain-containing protein, partial [Spirochaetia bacterium]|nr:putative DNA binding domain-containing protein [Spirochaetia bacterium]